MCVTGVSKFYISGIFARSLLGVCVIPHEVRIKDGQLSCRTCGVTKKGWKLFGEEVTDQMRAIRINKVREREIGCRKKLNTEKKRSKISRVSERIEIKSFNV